MVSRKEFIVCTVQLTIKVKNIMIIWIASYPRSGNRYFRTLLNHFYDIPSKTIYRNRKRLAKTSSEILALQQSSETFFVKTHELPYDVAPAIYLVRDGRDALISYAHYILNIEQASQDFETILQYVITNPGYFGGWGNHVMTWNHRLYPTALIKFEELVTTSQPIHLIQKAFQTLEHTCDEPVRIGPLPTFQQLQQEHPLLFHRGQSGYWKTEMSPKLHRLFWQIHGEAMHQMGYREGS